MRTSVSGDNPFGCNRTGYAWEKLAGLAGAHLDFGCYQGTLLDALSRRGPRRLVGIDANREAIEAGRRQYSQIELLHSAQPLPLPFTEQTFASISLLDVLEHVPDQPGLLSELARVLQNDGLLIVTVPRQYALSFMDLGNLKFRVPRLHRWFYCLRHSRAEYDRRYRCNPDGLIGDVSAEKGWHEHFTEQHLAELLERCGFEVEEFDGSAFFTRAFAPAAQLLNGLGWVRRLLGRLSAADARRFASMNLFCTARKRPGPQRPESAGAV